MSPTHTRVAGTTVLLGEDPDAVELDVRDGNLVIHLATGVSIVADFADQDTLDKLATVTAEAAAVNRHRTLWQAVAS
ncbi:MAG TPA: hypothetical protein VK028_02415 [Micromonosporaceae bacterium]|nr:hypothetical protein [Micromonosporaceae bacterium]